MHFQQCIDDTFPLFLQISRVFGAARTKTTLIGDWRRNPTPPHPFKPLRHLSKNPCKKRKLKVTHKIRGFRAYSSLNFETCSNIWLSEKN